MSMRGVDSGGMSKGSGPRPRATLCFRQMVKRGKGPTANISRCPLRTLARGVRNSVLGSVGELSGRPLSGNWAKVLLYPAANTLRAISSFQISPKDMCCNANVRVGPGRAWANRPVCLRKLLMCNQEQSLDL